MKAGIDSGVLDRLIELLGQPSGREKLIAEIRTIGWKNVFSLKDVDMMAGPILSWIERERIIACCDALNPSVDSSNSGRSEAEAERTARMPRPARMSGLEGDGANAKGEGRNPEVVSERSPTTEGRGVSSPRREGDSILSNNGPTKMCPQCGNNTLTHQDTIQGKEWRCDNCGY